jgi:hypothetical protein
VAIASSAAPYQARHPLTVAGAAQVGAADRTPVSRFTREQALQAGTESETSLAVVALARLPVLGSAACSKISMP